MKKILCFCFMLLISMTAMAAPCDFTGGSGIISSIYQDANGETLIDINSSELLRIPEGQTKFKGGLKDYSIGAIIKWSSDAKAADLSCYTSFSEVSPQSVVKPSTCKAGGNNQCCTATGVKGLWGSFPQPNGSILHICLPKGGV